MGQGLSQLSLATGVDPCQDYLMGHRVTSNFQVPKLSAVPWVSSTTQCLWEVPKHNRIFCCHCFSPKPLPGICDEWRGLLSRPGNQAISGNSVQRRGYKHVSGHHSCWHAPKYVLGDPGCWQVPKYVSRTCVSRCDKEYVLEKRGNCYGPKAISGGQWHGSHGILGLCGRYLFGL